MKSAAFIAVILVLGYMHEYFRVKPFGYWSLNRAGVTQLFVPGSGKIELVEDVDQFREEDEELPLWSYNRSGSLIRACVIVFGVTLFADQVYSPFGGVFENLVRPPF